MGTKNNPGRFDCYANAAPDEPMFVLLGRDVHGPSTVRAWAAARQLYGEDPRKVQEARDCASAMEAWLAENGKVPAPVPIYEPPKPRPVPWAVWACLVSHLAIAAGVLVLLLR